MTWLEFLADVIGSLAWPAGIAFIVFLLRAPLRRVIQGLRSIGWRGFQADFGDLVEEAESAATQAELPPAAHAVGEPALSTELSSEIASAPRAAVIEAWLAVERDLEALAERAGLDPGERRYPSTPAVVGELVRRGVIDSALADVILDLKRARNVAVHARPYPVERDEVRDYVKLAGRVRSALRLTRQAQEAETEGRTTYDLLLYHDLTDPTPSGGGRVPSVGDYAAEWFGEIGRDRHVVAVGPGIHEGRITVVLAHGKRPMPEIQALLDRLPE